MNSKLEKLEKLNNSILHAIPELIYDDGVININENRIETKFKIPEHIRLNDVIKWHSLNNRNKYSHFEVIKGKAYFQIYEGELTESIEWDLSKSKLEDQSEELIDWLVELI